MVDGEPERFRFFQIVKQGVSKMADKANRNLELVHTDDKASVLRCKITGLMVVVPKNGGIVEWIEPTQHRKVG